MENSRLNAAHEKQRRAEALTKQGKFEEAAKCHETVVNLLSEVQSHLTSPDKSKSSLSNLDSQSVIPSIQSMMTLESLALQIDYHRRQAAVVRMKQARYEEYKTTLENEQKDFLDKRQTSHQVTEDCALRQAIYKTIEEQDSLLSLISLPDTNSQNFKHPKDTSTVIEELRTVNCTLRGLLGNLLNNLEEKEEEIRQLTERLNTLLSLNLNNDENKPNDTLRLAPLPPLAPLDMPVFEFTSS